MSHRTHMVERARDAGWKRGAALGLGSGLMMEMMLESNPGLNVIGVDHFVREDRRVRVVAIARRYAERCTLLVCTTAAAAPFVVDGSLDFVYIDAGHKYGCVRADIRAWWPKVREGGWFGGHDYNSANPGVVKAVDERFASAVKVNEYEIWWVEK